MLLLLFPLFAGTLAPHPPISFANGADIYAHWGGFLVISLALLTLLYDQVKPVLILLTALALSLEAAQAFIDTRTMSDALANLLGIICAFAIFRLAVSLLAARCYTPRI